MITSYASRGVLDQIYKFYLQPHLYYDNIIYHKYGPELKLGFTKKLQSIQYSAALAATGAWRGTNTDKDCIETFCNYIKGEARRLYHMFPELPMDPLTKGNGRNISDQPSVTFVTNHLPKRI